MKYFLDTNVIADSIRGKKQRLFDYFSRISASDIYVSAIVVAELEFGAAHSNDYAKNKRLYEDFITDFTVVPFEKSHSVVYGEIRHYLTAKGTPIGLNDMLIAATAIANDAVLVTHNTDEFARIPNIRLQDWTL